MDIRDIEPPKLMVISDVNRIIDMVHSGSKVLVQAMVPPRPLVNAIVTKVFGTELDKYIESGKSPSDGLAECLRVMRENGGNLVLAAPSASPVNAVKEYMIENQGNLPDAYVVLVDSTTLEKVKDKMPEKADFVKQFMDTAEQEIQAGKTETSQDAWARATHSAPETKH